MLNPVRLNQTKLPAVARPKVPTTPLNTTSPNLPRMSQKRDCVAEKTRQGPFSCGSREPPQFYSQINVLIFAFDWRLDHTFLEVESAGDVTVHLSVTCVACIPSSQHLQRARSTLWDSDTAIWRTCTCYRHSLSVLRPHRVGLSVFRGLRRPAVLPSLGAHPTHRESFSTQPQEE